MAENPLLPNAELRALRTWTKRAVSLAKKPAKSAKQSSRNDPSRNAEALFAATTLQLRSGDILVSQPADDLAAALLSPKIAKSTEETTTVRATASADHLHLAAGLAAGLKRAKTDRLVLAFARSGITEADWADALTWAQTDELPLVLAIADPSGPNAFRRDADTPSTALTWTSLQKLTTKLKLPVLSVDGEDAVAVYRVMQESVLRAHSGGGPAVLWAMLPRAEDLTRRRDPAASPLSRLERYMKTRKVPFS